jgi:hypothetical protein
MNADEAQQIYEKHQPDDTGICAYCEENYPCASLKAVFLEIKHLVTRLENDPDSKLNKPRKD